jgi:hypothetical protein
VTGLAVAPVDDPELNHWLDLLERRFGPEKTLVVLRAAEDKNFDRLRELGALEWWLDLGVGSADYNRLTPVFGPAVIRAGIDALAPSIVPKPTFVVPVPEVQVNVRVPAGQQAVAKRPADGTIEVVYENEAA